MRVFVDTSAFAQAFLRDEDGHLAVVTILDSAHRTAASELMFTETVSALTRARRARRLTKGRETEFRARLDEIWRSISAVPADWPTVRAAAELCARHRLHALDALHLASALSIAPLIDVFVAGDRRLLTAARAEGFATAEV